MNAVANGAQHQLHAFLNQALAYQRAGQPVEAAQYYLRAIHTRADYWQAHYNLGLCYQAMNEVARARDTYRVATQLNPECAEAHTNLGNTLRTLKQNEEAFIAYERALALKPTLVEASYNLALLQQAMGRFTDSTVSLRRTVANAPLKDEAWDALYRTHLALQQPEEASAAFLEWEAAVGQSALLTAAGLAQSRFLGDRVREKRYVQLATDWPFAASAPSELSPVVGLLQYFDVEPAALLVCYQRYDAAVKAVARKPVPLLPRRSAGRKIRIGYVSADFRRHVMGRIMAEILRTHDRNQFAITLISLCEKRYQDDVTGAFGRTADAFIDASTLTDYEAARVIAEADIDILVDLSAHTMAARPIIYAYRPARCIITHLGYHGALGLAAVDYKLTDKIADPPEMAQYQIEKPLYLDACLFPFTHLTENPQADARYLSNKPANHFVFGTFVNVLKLSARCLEAWRRILEQTPNALLAFSPLNTKDVISIERVLAEAGIALSRLHIIPGSKVDTDNRARYAAVDAVLDTFPYTGGDTTLAALDRDVPVVTLCGRRNAERVGASLLTHVGTPELIAYTEEQYISIACRLVREPDFLATASATIKRARLHTLFGNPATHTQALERAYLHLAREGVETEAKLSAADFFSEFRAALTETPVSEVRLAKLAEDQPTFVPLLQARAQIAHLKGDTRNVMQFLRLAIKTAPDDVESLLALGSVLLDSQSRASDEELNTLLACIEALPAQLANTISVMKVQARLLGALRKFPRAESLMQAACIAAPGDVEAQFIYANTLANLDRAGAAFAQYQRVLMLDAKHPAASINAAQLLTDRGEWTSAETLLRHAMEVNPGDETAYRKLALILKRERKWSAFVSLGKMLDARFPSSLNARLIRAEGYRFEGDLGAESRQIAALAETIITLEDQHDLVEEVAHPILQRLVALELGAACIERLSDRYLIALHALYGRSTHSHPAAKEHESLHIGALVSDLDDSKRAEAIVRALVPFVGGKHRCTLYCLNGVPADKFDALVKQISPTTNGVLLAGIGIDNARTHIVNDALDVLIDLTGHRHIAAMPILIGHVARLTISNGALATHTFGVSAYLPDDLDFELCDSYTALPAWQLGGPARAMLASPHLLPSPKQRPAVDFEGRSANEAFVFSLPASLTMVSRETLALARNILDRLPHALLAVDAPDEVTLQAWQRICQGVGIAASKVTPRGFAAAPFANAVLDARPGSDAVAVSDALATGTPVVTMRGPTAMERMGYAVLSAAGLDELVADSGPDYVNLATKLARDSMWRAALLGKIAEVNANANRQPAVPGSGVEALLMALKKRPDRAART